MIGRTIAAFFCGIIFSLGLAVSGMTQPAKIVGFLDVFGNWDYSLVFVLASAVGVYYVSFQWVMKRKRPLLAHKFLIPTRKDVDPRSIVGGILFGAGWGVSGLCPGPILSTLANRTTSVIILFLCMTAGLFITSYIDRAGS